MKTHLSNSAALVLLTTFSGVTLGQTFTQVVTPGLTGGSVYSLSADGTRGAGTGFDSQSARAIFWTSSSGGYAFGFEPGVPLGSYGTAISGNGQVVVGYAGGNGYASGRPFRWSGPGTYQELGRGGFTTAIPNSTSYDGSVTVGYIEVPSIDHETAPCIWNASGAVAFLPSNGPGTASQVSGDGSTIVGSYSGSTRDYAVIWNSQHQLIQLALPSATSNAYASGVNFDGSRVVGGSYEAGTANRALLWQGGQILILKGPSGEDIAGGAGGISYDGSIITGLWDFSTDIHGPAGIWTASTGVISFYDYLTSNGLNIPADIVFSSVGVSGDGRSFSAVTANYGSFIATVPSPGAVSLAVVAGLLGCSRRRVSKTVCLDHVFNRSGVSI